MRSDTLPILFAHKAAAYRVAADKVFGALNLNTGQVAVLLSLMTADGQTQAELARNLRISAPTVTKMLRTMVDRGFVVSRPCDHDSRSVRIYLTEATRDIEGEIESCWQDASDIFFKAFTDTEKLIMIQLLSKMP